MREIFFGLCLVACAVSITVGVAHWSHGAAYVVAGVLGVAVSFLALSGDVADTEVDA
jgi:hypothetical protein